MVSTRSVRQRAEGLAMSGLLSGLAAVGKVLLLWTPWRTGADGFPAPAA